MNENLKDGTAKASARRRLIRGVFAAPAALTLFSGSVAAGSLSCVAAVVNHRRVNEEADGSSTSFLRVPLRVLRQGSTQDVLAKFVSAEDLGLLLPLPPAVSTSYLPSGKWECVFTSDESKFKAGDIYTSDGIATISSGNSPEMEGSSEYVAVRVSADGDVLGVQGFYDGGAPTSAMFVSCWCSFGGDAPFQGM